MDFFGLTGVRQFCLTVAACVLLMAAPSYADAATGDPAPETSTAQASADSVENALLAAMITLVTTHDIAVVAGVLPLPAVSYAAEVTEFGANLALKAIPPRLITPNNLRVDSQGASGPGYITDGCGIEFELLSAQAGYANLFGIANFRDPYTQLSPFKFYPWKKFQDPDSVETRWGFLRAPKLYHANTDVTLEIRTPYTLRKYNQGTGVFGEDYTPIDTFAENPQQVYLPIGEHPIEWHATAQLNLLSDVAVPGVMLVFNALSELKTIYGGAKAAKLAKAGIGDEVAEEALDPKGAARLSEGVKKFNDVWQKAFEQRQARKAATAAAEATKKLRKKFRVKVIKLVGKTLKKLFKKLKKAGVNSIHGDIRDEITRLVPGEVAAVVEVVWSVYNERYPSSGQGFSIPFVNDNLDGNTLTIIRKVLSEHGPGHILELLTVDTAKTVKAQAITVLDSEPPTINIDPAPLVIEATDFGGTRLYRARAQLLKLAEAVSSDNCGRTPELILNGPELLLLGQQQVTWTAKDRGPNPSDDGQDYAPMAVQNIIVRDTQPPLLLAPPSKVILDTADVPLAAANIGNAVAIDLVDVQPQITNDAPAVFPVNSRTPIEWAAVDDSGNAAQSSQLITVKDSNTPPMANTTTASTLTAQPVDIRLTAIDVDELGGRFDPLWFRIESAPQKGDFVAPLYPFFIEDYRTQPNDGLGENYDPITDEIFTFIGTNYCDTGLAVREPPRNFVHEARYVHVTDDGIRYVLDEFFVCDPFDNKAFNKQRFSQWNADGDFLGQLQIGENPEDAPVSDAFRIDRDGFLYYNTASQPGSSSNELFLWRCPVDWQSNPDLNTSGACVGAYKFENSSVPDSGLNVSTLAYARIDSRMNVAYVVDGQNIFAFELLDTGGTRYLAELGPKDDLGAVLADWFGTISTLEVGSDGALYANDVSWHRLHKIAPITLDEVGEFVLGDYIGWAGKCTGSGNNACEVDPAKPGQGRSRGYSCTYEPDSCTVAANSRSGSRQGQLDTPKFISIDPNDILYVADFGNERVQRFSPDGSFAGEAVSEGSGINKGDRPSFVLGNMGKPASVAVNSSQFFVVDRDEQFVHIFGTLPFKDITDNEATVTYVSDQDFPNPNVMADDEFSFSVTDGLDRSEPAKVTVTVSRNFRPPEALSETITTPEDMSIDFELPARDPDGIVGKDFLGLDTLTYTLTRWPEKGTLSGNADTWVYTPNPDFYGEDSLSFKVNDGRDDSNEGTLTIRVTPVNDPPVVTAAVPERVALGFPMLAESTFTDDRVVAISEAVPGGFSDGYTGRVNWGDGGTDTTGEFMSQADEASIAGVAVVAPPTSDSEGRTFAQHTYDQTGEQTIEVCVADSDALEACDEFAITVESLVSMGISGIFYDEPLAEGEVTLQEIADGSTFTFEVMIVNSMPSVGSGLPAENVVLDLQLPAANLTVNDITIDQGSCSRNSLEVVCSIGMLNPGAEVKLTMTASGPGSLIYNEDRDFEGTLSTSSAALNQDIGLYASVELVADTTDSDGDGMSDTFEKKFGLNPTIDDSAGDIDGDGLSNLDEQNEGSSPQVADTDGDGLTDGEEFAAGKDPLSDDVPPELSIPADNEVNATGTLTLVNLGAAIAVDFKDGPVEVVASNPGPFPPGRNVVTWSAFDEAGNRVDGDQFVNVVPIVNFQINQAVSEGTTARVLVELNGPAVNYPVTVPFEISGTAINPDDHDGVSGEAVIVEGLSTDIEISIVKDPNDEPDETIVLAMGAPTNAVAGAINTHAITVTELNLSPKVVIGVEQQGRSTTTIVSGAGLITLSANVHDDPAQEHSFDWSASDSALIDPNAVNDPSYFLQPFGLSAGLYDMRVSVMDDGVSPLFTEASSLLNVANEQLILLSSDDTDGDGESDAAEGPGDGDGDRIADYLDDVANSNMLRLAADGRMLETTTGLTLRLGATAFSQSNVYASIKEQDVGTDIDYGYSSGLLDFEITKLDQGGSTQIVIPLANPISTGAVYRTYVSGQWWDFVEDLSDSIASAPGERGACPPPTNNAYRPGLTEQYGCLQLTLTDGGPNDLDGVADGVLRITSGLAVPVSVDAVDMPQTNTTLVGDGEAIMVRMRLHSDSGDAVLKSLTLQASGNADDALIDDVILVYDTNRDGEWGDDDIVLSSGRFSVDDGTLTLILEEPLEVPVGDMDLLIIYVFGNI